MAGTALPEGVVPMRRTSFWTYENRLLVLLTISFGFTIWDRVALTTLAPAILKDLGLNNTALGIMSGALSVTLAISGYFFGQLADRTHARKRLLLAGIVLFSLCSSISGLAVSLATMVAARLFMGLTEGPILPLSYSIIALESSPHRRSFNHGVLANFATCLIGGVLGPVILTLLTEAYSWRLAFFVTGVPGLILAVLIWRLVREPAVGARPEPHVPAAVATATRTVLPPERRRNIPLCLLLLCGLYTWLLVTLTYQSQYLVHVVGLTLVQAGSVAAVVGLAGLSLAIVISWLADRIGRKPTVIIGGLLGLIVPLAFMYAHQSVVLMTVLVFLGWSFIGCSPLFAGTIPSESVPPERVARTLALIIGAAEIVGGVIMPVLSGRLADRYGLDAPMWVVFAATALTVAGSCFLVETRPRTAPVAVATAAAS
ncbi:MAG: MFS transporter [Gammaproteobacteria bacterium]|nr:MFS transporter [Gammaproteobacteria bacterium]